MALRIGILGTRGIPNRHGGFEQFAAYLSQGLVEKGHEVTVYNSHRHPYKEDSLNNVNIVHCFDPEFLVGSAGQFVYDLNCIIDARKKNFDILLVLGYTSSSLWGRLYPRRSIVITNMDGLEWKRTKYTKKEQRFLQYAEKLAVKYSDFHVADSVVIQEYLNAKYNIKTEYISYGAEVPAETDKRLLATYNICEKEYFLVIARMEPENNIEMILDGICTRDQNRKILVIGKTDNSYGRKMIDKFGKDSRVTFLGSIYDPIKLHTLRTYSLLYFHGHSVGGTNPSLLEAMASGALICAHDNAFNEAVLGENASYFSSPADVAQLATNVPGGERAPAMIQANKEKVRTEHAWDKIIGEYENFMFQAINLQNERVVLYPRYQYE